ncbi:MAG: hypothetical protein FWF72_03900, partial [Paludibacter sp.]|nr:hypothetical protein [Paludibacter sp.]
MKNKNNILTVIGIILIFLSCNKNPQNSSKSSLYDKQELAAAMQIFLADSANAADSTLLALYEKHDFAPFFVDENGITKPYYEFCTQLAKIEQDGLWQGNFDFERMNILANKINENIDIHADFLALFDYLVVKNYVKLCSALRFGAVNPKSANLTNYYFDIEQPAPDFVENCINNINENLIVHIQSLEQGSENYEIIRKARNYYVNLQDSVFEKIPALPEKQTIKFGQKHSSIPLIAKRLFITNEISADAADSALNYHKFDSLLLKSINNFQKKRGLLVDSE